MIRSCTKYSNKMVNDVMINVLKNKLFNGSLRCGDKDDNLMVIYIEAL